MASSDPVAPAVDYEMLERQVDALLSDERDLMANGANFSAFVYHTLPVLNWAGFYFPDERGLLLGPFCGKPACTRLPPGRGVCGAAYTSRQTKIVADVAQFDDHIVCDSASQSEIVIPVLVNNAAAGVFDIDSPVTNRFDDADRVGLERLVARFVARTDIPERYLAPRPPDINARIEIDTCRDHHVVIRYLTEEIGRSTPDGHTLPALLKRLRSLLVAHLKLEDDCVYPRLSRSSDVRIREKAARYAGEMGDLRERFVELYERWSAPGTILENRAAWENEWQSFERDLLKRMDAEDDDLYADAIATWFKRNAQET